MLKLLRLGMVPHSRLSHLATLSSSGTPVCSLMMPLSSGSAWTCCFGEDPEGRLGLLRHTGVAICASGAIKIRRLSSETHLKSDAEMTDHCGRRHAYGGSSGCTGNMENVVVQIWPADFALVWQKMRAPQGHEGLQAPFHPA